VTVKRFNDWCVVQWFRFWVYCCIALDWLNCPEDWGDWCLERAQAGLQEYDDYLTQAALKRGKDA
jgi:hypothetical protein